MATVKKETKIIKPAVAAVTEDVVLVELSMQEAERLCFVAGQFCGDFSSLYCALSSVVERNRVATLLDQNDRVVQSLRIKRV